MCHYTTSKIICIGKNENNVYEYRIGLILKNISESVITLFSKSQGGSKFFDEPDLPTVLIGNVSELEIDGVLVIPSLEELGLVNIRPGEGAQVYEIFKAGSSLGQKSKVGYHASSVYGGRYKNWSGVVTSGVVHIANNEACQP